MKRITLLVEDELFERLNAGVPHGFRRHLLSAVLKMIMAAISKHGDAVTGAIVAGKFKLVEDTDSTNG